MIHKQGLYGEHPVKMSGQDFIAQNALFKPDVAFRFPDEVSDIYQNPENFKYF